MNQATIICKTTGESITAEEKNYRDGKRNDMLRKLQLKFGKTREQVLALFRFYSSKTQANKHC